MKDRIMLGLWKYMLNVPPVLMDMRKKLEKEKLRYEAAMGFMTDEHRRVHHFTVRELPKAGRPIPPDSMASALNISRDRVIDILNDLEEHMTFLFRNKQGEVAWAYPVTTDRTPHYLTFSTGEQIYGA
jgi:hypothetical protein